MKKLFHLVILCSLFGVAPACAQPLNQKKVFTRQDTLRGSLTPERAWWDATHYKISVTPDYNRKTIEGSNELQFKVVANGKRMQIDLQQPMQLTSAVWNDSPLPIQRDGNVYYIEWSKNLEIGSVQKVLLYFKGAPRAAVTPPWDGGWIWSKDKLGRPWMSVAVQGLGASAWYPCKDYQGDEPDSAAMNITVPDSLVAVANGRFVGKEKGASGTTYKWAVHNPINNYNLVPYIGHYVNWADTYSGEAGLLNCTYWVMDYNEAKSKSQFKQVHQTLKALEHWFGPYPFYSDGYQLVEAPHLGMEHQSAVAYGNNFGNGYLGNDLSGTGWGLKWDYIIVHETGHEWFGNNITAKDIADMWIHEGFTDYSETLFVEQFWGKKAGSEYVQGLREQIQNDLPIIGPYGVNQEGSGDMYYKGANLVHTIRQLVQNDTLFRNILRGLNKDFYHQTVTTQQVEEYISQKSGIDLAKVFDQYLRTTKIPVLELKRGSNDLQFRWSNVVPGFEMPVQLNNGQWLKPTAAWQKVTGSFSSNIAAAPDFYVRTQQ